MWLGVSAGVTKVIYLAGPDDLPVLYVTVIRHAFYVEVSFGAFAQA